MTQIYAFTSSNSLGASCRNPERSYTSTAPGPFYGLQITSDTTVEELSKFLQLSQSFVTKNADGSLTADFATEGHLVVSASNVTQYVTPGIVNYPIGTAATVLALTSLNGPQPQPVQSNSQGAGNYFAPDRPLIFDTPPTWGTVFNLGNASYVRIDELKYTQP